MKLSIAALLVGSAAAYAPSSFSGTSLKASSNGASMSMSTGMGVNGFGRIGRLVTRIMMEDEDCSLNAINAGSATPDYMAYQYKYDTIHGIAKGSVEIDGDFLVLNGEKIMTSRCLTPRRSAGAPSALTTFASPPVSSSPRRRPKPSLTEVPRRLSTPRPPRMTPKPLLWVLTKMSTMDLRTSSPVLPVPPTDLPLWSRPSMMSSTSKRLS